jgi:hypothetical protein
MATAALDTLFWTPCADKPGFCRGTSVFARKSQPCVETLDRVTHVRDVVGRQFGIHR